MKNILFSLFFSSILTVSDSQAQAKDTFAVELNKHILQPGDTLAITADYIGANKKILPPSTLEIIVQNEQGSRSRLRWPVLNGTVSGKIFLPNLLPRGKYTFAIALQPHFFEVVGKINAPARTGLVSAMLLTNKGDWDTQEVPVEPDGTFTVGQWLFENNAIMAFSGTQKNSQPLDVRISTRIDSAYEPLAVAIREVYVGTPAIAVKIDSLGNRNKSDVTSFFNKGELLPAVIVTAKTKSVAEQFNDQYSTGLFKSMNERIFSVFDDPTAISFQSVLSYLQGRVAGLQINQNFGGGGRAIWRGSPVSFFIDEMRTDAQQVNTINMANVAIIKVYPPPFSGAAGGGSGGAIAVYTRRGGESQLLPGNRSVFKIRGYTPLVTTLEIK